MSTTVNTIDPKLIDELIKNYKSKDDIFGVNGLVNTLIKSFIERSLNAELTTHLGYDKDHPDGKNIGNSRNGGYKKTIKGEAGELEIEVPRDRNSTFEPLLIQKNQT